MTTEGRIFRAGEGAAYDLGNMTLVFKPAPSGFTIGVATGEPGAGAALHRHGYDEWHIITEGETVCPWTGRPRPWGPATWYSSLAGSRTASGR